ncbi:MAG: ABC transporter permease [Butyrivibrio sp.]|nr:ABC transporter permease [Butyrivibrio sp.]
MSQILEYITSAIKNILNNRMRSLLTMLGIIIGIMSVIIVITLGDGMSAYVSGELNSLGGNYLQVSLDAKETSEVFTVEDLNAIKDEVPEIMGLSVDFSVYGTAEGAKGSYDAYVTGCSEDYHYIATGDIIKGKYFTKEQVEGGDNVCVIRKSDAKKLFGTTDVIGMTITLSAYSLTGEYTIIGIYDDPSGFMSLMEASDTYVLNVEIPYTAMGNTFHMDTDEFINFDLYATPDVATKAGKEIVTILETRHGLRGSKAISVMSFGDITEQVESVLSSITLFMSVVAAISLLVGGIGVMNIMLVSVTERTREIGIRKSIGARTSSILVQFLAEAAILTLIGGVIGIIMGILIASLICYAVGFNPVINPMVVMGAALFSTAVGIFFGLYPARKAAKMRPIDALRH